MGSQLVLDLVIVAAVIFGIVCVVGAAWQARPSHPPIDRRERLKRSILVGFAVSGLVLSTLVIVGAIDGDYQWSVSAIIGALCLALPIQVMATIGAYIQFGYLPWMQGQMRKAIGGRATKSGEASPKK